MPGFEYIESKVNQSLRSSKAIRKICPNKVFPVLIPQGTKIPAVVYQRVTTSPDYTLRGYSSESVLIMINSFALSFKEVRELAKAVRETMSKSPLNAILINETDIYENDSRVFCVSAHYSLKQVGGYCNG